MKPRLPFLPEPYSRAVYRPLAEGRVWQRSAIAALSIGGIDHRSIVIFTDTHPKTVHRWVCRVEEGKLCLQHLIIQTLRILACSISDVPGLRENPFEVALANIPETLQKFYFLSCECT